jgi:hypothetical protein
MEKMPERNNEYLPSRDTTKRRMNMLKRICTSAFRLLGTCVLLTFCSAPGYGQSITIDQYVNNPSVLNTRQIARQGAGIIPQLIDRFEASESRLDRIACLKAINCSIEQTNASQKLMQDLAAKFEESPELGAHAMVGDWLNHPRDWNRFKTLAREGFVFLENDVLTQIGDRALFAISEAIQSAEASDAGDLAWLLSSIESEGGIPGISEVALACTDRWMNECLTTNDGQVFDAASQLLALGNGDSKEREWISKLLASSIPLAPLSDRPESNRMRLLFVCLNRLESRELLKSDYEHLVKTFDDRYLMNGPRNEGSEASNQRRHTLLAYLSERQAVLFLQGQKGNAAGFGIYGHNGPPEVVNFASQWVIDSSAMLLCSDVPEAVSEAEKQLLAVAQSEWMFAEQKAQGVVDQLIEMNTETSLLAAARLMGQLKITEIQRQQLEQMVRRKEKTHTLAVAFTAARTLAGLSPTTGDLRRNYLSQSIAIAEEASDEQRSRYLIDLLQDETQLALDAIAAFWLEQPDTQLKQDMIVAVSNVVNSDPSRNPDSGTSAELDLEKLTDALLPSLGESELLDTRSVPLLTKHLLQTDSAYSQYVEFLENSDLDRAKMVVGHLLLQSAYDKVQSRIGDLKVLVSQHPELIRSHPIQFTDPSLALNQIAQLPNRRALDDPGVQAFNLARLLEGQREVLERLAEIANDKASPAQESARKTLDEHRRVLEQIIGSSN